MPDRCRSPTALVIGNDPDEAGILIELLSAEGFSVLSAESGAQGIDLLKRGIQPRLMIIDWMLARDDAEDFLTYARAERDLLTVPVLVVTRVTDHGVDLVADAVFQKPIDPQRLREAVRTLVRGA